MKTSCIAPKCKNKVRARGLCGSHYAYAQYLVSSGKTSWEELEAAGKVTVRHLESNRGEFTKWLLGK